MYVCVCVRQLWLSYFLDVDLPRCCLLGFAKGGTVGTAFFCVSVCVCLDVRLSEGKVTLSWVCVFLHSGFGASVQVYVSCHAFVKASVCSKSHAVPQSSWQGERQKTFLKAEAALTCAFLSYQEPANAKIKQKKDIFRKSQRGQS